MEGLQQAVVGLTLQGAVKLMKKGYSEKGRMGWDYRGWMWGVRAG